MRCFLDLLGKNEYYSFCHIDYLEMRGKKRRKHVTSTTDQQQQTYIRAYFSRQCAKQIVVVTNRTSLPDCPEIFSSAYITMDDAKECRHNSLKMIMKSNAYQMLTSIGIRYKGP
jgi:hypothetical protein